MTPPAGLTAAFLAALALTSGAAHGESRTSPRDEAGVQSANLKAKGPAQRQDGRERDQSGEARPAVRVILASPYAGPNRPD